MVVADAATVAFAEALDLSKTTAPGRDLFATFTLEPDVREHARIDGDQATVCSDVSSTENLWLGGWRYIWEPWFGHDLHLVVTIFAIRIGINATVYKASSRLWRDDDMHIVERARKGVEIVR